MFGILILLGFPTERWEMEIVASKFERDGLIDYREFVNMLKDKKPVSFESTLRRFLRLLYINSSKSSLFLLPQFRSDSQVSNRPFLVALKCCVYSFIILRQVKSLRNRRVRSSRFNRKLNANVGSIPFSLSKWLKTSTGYVYNGLV